VSTKFFRIVLVSLFLVSAAQAIPVFTHVGATNPTTEGWAAIGLGFSVTTGPLTPDPGTGTDAWSVVDPSTAGGSVRLYEQVPTAATHSMAASQGWSLSTEARFLQTGTGTFPAMNLEYATGSTRYVLAFDREDITGNPIVQLVDVATGAGYIGPTFTLVGAGDGGYHTYDLIYDPTAMSADLFVDGIERLSDYTGFAGAIDRVVWGAGASDGTGQGHFSSVVFSVGPNSNGVPEIDAGVATLPLAICFFTLLILYDTRRHSAV
jgi:large repetitive protein